MNVFTMLINKERLKKDLVELSKFGKSEGAGLMRTALSDADIEARRWFKTRMAEAGLRVKEDAVANIIGRLDPTEGDPNAPCVATGSHIDAVPHGGNFDGALGICGGLEAIRTIKESGLPISYPIELIVFTDEEGAHYAGTFGSRAMFNLFAEGEIYRSKGEGRPSLAESLKRIGKNPEKIEETLRSPSEFRAFIEMHIEQGPVLESMNIPVGIVEGIVGIDRHLIHVTGRPGHSGTTPMNLRDDALVKAAGIITAINNAVKSAGPDIVGTIGELNVYPGAFNIIPGKIDMYLDLRSINGTSIKTMRDCIGKIVQSVDKAQMVSMLSKAPVSMNPSIMNIIELSCGERGIDCHRMNSGAGHDSTTFPKMGVPAGMIFIPCVDGKSHCPEEDINWEDAAKGTQVLADTILKLASGEEIKQE